ncbi:hypothetical protein J3R04_004934 [Spirilliplanes yamanashiensis]|nr:hypothetical protein [Spirilliplanes yamanashiensis]
MFARTGAVKAAGLVLPAVPVCAHAGADTRS